MVVVMGDDTVDFRECLPYRHRLTAGSRYPAVAGVDLHPGSDGGLRQIGWSDVPFPCELVQFSAGSSLSSASRKSRRVAGDASSGRGRQTSTTDDASTLIPFLTPVGSFCSHRPCSYNLESSVHQCRQHHFPTSRGTTFPLFLLLLVSVEDGRRKLIRASFPYELQRFTQQFLKSLSWVFKSEPVFNHLFLFGGQYAREQVRVRVAK